MFIHSEDFDPFGPVGTSSTNGVWTFPRNVRGNWGVIGQHVESQTIPWMWDGTNKLLLTIHDPLDVEISVTYTVTFNPSTGTQNDPDTIANLLISDLQASNDAIALTSPFAARLFSFSLNTEAKTITLLIDDDPIDVLWEGLGNFHSTCREAFDKASTSNELNTQNVDINYSQMTTDPKYLECYITESNSEYNTSHGTSPTLLFSTRDGEFTSQSFSVPTSGNSLTIQIKRMKQTNNVPLSSEWYLILKSSS